MSALVLKSGLQTSVQDLGRFGLQCYGVVVGGAVDAFCARLANALAGNPDNAALLEMALVGPEIGFEKEALIAWCRAEFDARLAGGPLPPNRPVRVPAGATASFGAVRQGARAWLAIAGGIAVPLVLGSRSTCRRFGFGGLQGRALIDGDRLALGGRCAWSQRIISSLRVTGRRHCDWSVRPAALGKPVIGDRLRVLRGHPRGIGLAGKRGRAFSARRIASPRTPIAWGFVSRGRRWRWSNRAS